MESEFASVLICDNAMSTDVLLAFGRAYHQAGIPTDALEELMQDIAAALGVELQVNALPTSLTVAVGPGTAQRLVILRLEPGRLDLKKLAFLNFNYRRLITREISVETALSQVVAIDSNADRRPVILTVLAYALLSLGASVLLGGGTHEIRVSALTGIAIGVIGALADRSDAVNRMFEVVAPFVATLVVAAYDRFIGPIALYITIIASIVQLLPGFTLTTALHELASRHLVAGTARLGGVLVTLLSLGCGFSLAVAIIGTNMLPEPTFLPIHPTWFALVPASLIMAIAIAIILRSRLQDVGWVCASCVVAVATSRVFAVLPGHQVAAFGSAFVVGVLTNLAARYLQIPQAVMLIPGILVLVPGSLSYESIIYAFQADVTNAANVAIIAVLTSILIVAGTLLSQLLIRPMRRVDLLSPKVR